MPDQDLGSFNELFFTTAFDHVKEIRQQFPLIIEDHDNSEILYEIYRHAHSLKGSSQLMGFVTISELCQQIIAIVHKENQSQLDSAQMENLESIVNDLHNALLKIS